MWRKSILLTAIVTLTGCMTTEARWSTADLNNFKTDCSSPNQRIMLETQRVSKEDQVKNNLIISSLPGTMLAMLDDTYEERLRAEQGYRNNAQKLTEYFREKTCRQQEFDKQYYRH
jgi:hypothetical protein